MKKLLRALFSRYFISAVLIIAELALLLYIMIFASRYSVYAFAAMILLHILAVFSIVNRDANPEYKVSWLVVVLLVPIFGILLYEMFYSRKISKKDSELMHKIYYSVDEAHSRYSSSSRSSVCGALCERNDHLAELRKCSGHACGRANSILAEDPLADIYRGCESRYFAFGEEMYASMLEDIRRAEHFIFLEYFIIAEGKMWDGILELLKEKASLGVEVRLLCDDIGCMSTLPHGFDKKMEELGISARRFSPITPRVSVVHNNRDHRKILLIDGHVAYTGGINIADEYINERLRFGHWKDGGVRIEGEAACGYLSLFFSMWDLTAKSLSDHDKYFEISSRKNNAAHTDDGGFYIPFSSGPAPIYTAPVGKNAIISIINQACDYVYITTPYLIIDHDLTEALCSAAKRGVDVRIVTPGIPDKKAVKLMSKSFYPKLIRGGVRISEYTPGFIHEKLIVSDDSSAIIGTINLDYRSLAHHFENALWIYKSPTVISVRDAFLDTVSRSNEIDENEARLNIGELLVRNIMRIFAPLL